MQALLGQFCDWLVQTPFSIYLQNLPNMVPVVQTIHIVAIAALLSSAVVIDLRVLKVISKDRPLQSILHRFEPGIWWGLAALAISGSLLITAEPFRSILSFQFQFKMVMLVLGVIVTLAIKRTMKSENDATTPPLARVLAVLSLAIWAAMIFAGRWIAYA